MKVEFREIFAKQQRLLKQIDFVKNEQQIMIDFEFQNIENLKHEKKTSKSTLILFIDVASKQIVFFFNFDNDILIFIFLISFDLKSFEIVDNFSHVCKIFICFF